jgi:hypothetical protein
MSDVEYLGGDKLYSSWNEAIEFIVLTLERC